MFGGGAAVAVVIVIIIILLSHGGTSSKTSGAGEVFLQPTAATGNSPFTPSVAAATPAAPVSPPALPSGPDTGAPSSSSPAAQAVASYSGSTPGLYGGTRQISSCDSTRLVDFLEANPDKARAWAGVEGISPSDIRAYVATLTPALLRADTRVTNHGFENGRATTYQSVLQAGTAVLVDRYGVPRVRCYCGNPLTEPIPLTETPAYTGPSWPAFQPTTVVVVAPAPQPQVTIIIVDVATGAPFARPVGGDGSTDTDAPPGTFSTPTPAPTPTAPPTPTAAAGPPDLSGSWNSPQNPAAPPWQLSVSGDRKTLTGGYRGGDGHSGLVGSFRTTLNADGTAYSGTLHVTEADTIVDGTITFTIVSPNELSVRCQSPNGPICSFTLTRSP